MTLFVPDANVLIHALREQSPDHQACRQWLLKATAQGHAIGITELVEVALLRIPTLPRLQLVPMSAVLGFWKDDLLRYPQTCRLGAGSGHPAILTRFIRELNLCGNDINDAWLAALVTEHKATLVSTDKGFARFPGLDWLDPRKAES